MSIPSSVYQKRLSGQTVKIAQSNQISDIVDCQGASPVGMVIPSAVTGTSISFFASLDAAPNTFMQMTDAGGTDISVGVTANRYIPLDPSLFAGVQYLQIKSNSAEAADRLLQVIMGPMWQ